MSEKPAEDESELHLMRCEKIVSENDFREQMKNITYNDIFGPLEIQISAIKTWEIVLECQLRYFQTVLQWTPGAPSCRAECLIYSQC
jgi:hypothetical protein